MMTSLKRYFLVGLIAILPLWVTYFILLAVFSVVVSLAKPFFSHVPFVSHSPLLLNLLSFVGTLAAVFGLGIFVANVVGRRIFKKVESWLERIPFLSGIYSSIRKLTELFYSDGDASKRFQRVVAVEYPRQGVYSLGFVTSEGNQTLEQIVGKRSVTVFIPTTPNPTSGVLIVVPEDEVIATHISVDGAIKMIISGGVIPLHE